MTIAKIELCYLQFGEVMVVTDKWDHSYKRQLMIVREALHNPQIKNPHFLVSTRVIFDYGHTTWITTLVGRTGNCWGTQEVITPDDIGLIRGKRITDQKHIDEMKRLITNWIAEDENGQRS